MSTGSERPTHSRSIVSCASKRLKTINFTARRFDFTVTLTVTLFCLVPIDGDRRRKQLRQLDVSHRIAQLITQSLSIKWNIAFHFWECGVTADWKTPEEVKKAHPKA